MAEQNGQREQQANESEFGADSGLDTEANQNGMADATAETQPMGQEDEGRWDEKKAATVGAAVLEQDGFNAKRPNGLLIADSADRFTKELADIAEDVQRVKGGAHSEKLHPNLRVTYPAGARSESFLSDLQSNERGMQRAIEEEETAFDSNSPVGSLESKKVSLAKYREGLSQIELEQLEKQRAESREQLQGYLNKQSDYYAELYELNPDRFAGMPTKEFMEHRDELAGLEGLRAKLEGSEREFAGVVSTLKRVLDQATDIETSVTLENDGEVVKDGHQIWFDHQFLRNDYCVASMLNAFQGYRYKLSHIFDSHQNGDETVRNYAGALTRGDPEFTDARFHHSDITPDEEAVWAESEAYFQDYVSKRLDVAPRQLIDGLSALFEKYRAGYQAKLEEANAAIAEFKQRFAPKQEENQPGGGFENN